MFDNDFQVDLSESPISHKYIALLISQAENSLGLARTVERYNSLFEEKIFTEGSVLEKLKKSFREAINAQQQSLDATGQLVELYHFLLNEQEEKEK